MLIMNISDFGTELAFAVQQMGLPTTELDVDITTSIGMRLFDVLLNTLAVPNRPVFLVSEPVQDALAYTNSLAVLFEDESSLANLITLAAHRTHIKNDFETTIQDIAEERKARLVGKRLHTLDMKKLLSSPDGGVEKWNETFTEIVNTAKDRKYILVIYNIELLFTGDESVLHQARVLFLATRPRSILQFIAPMSWYNYVTYVEAGYHRSLIQHRKPFFLSPRPQGYPYAGMPEFEPDEFVFSHSQHDS